MAKKSSFNILYIIGMAAVVIGAFLPLVSTKLGGFDGHNLFDQIGDGFAGICSLLVFIGAVAGLIVAIIQSKVKSADLIKLICLIVSVAAGIVMVLNMSGVGRSLMKAAFNPGLGFWVIIAGWVVGIVGYITKK